MQKQTFFLNEFSKTWYDLPAWIQLAKFIFFYYLYDSTSYLAIVPNTQLFPLNFPLNLKMTGSTDNDFLNE